jgi:hypothetical protein
VYRLGYGLGDREIVLRFPAGARDLSVLHRFQEDTNDLSLPVGRGGFLQGVKRLGGGGGVDSSRDYECVAPLAYSPYMPSRRTHR